MVYGAWRDKPGTQHSRQKVITLAHQVGDGLQRSYASVERTDRPARLDVVEHDEEPVERAGRGAGEHGVHAPGHDEAQLAANLVEQPGVTDGDGEGQREGKHAAHLVGNGPRGEEDAVLEQPVEALEHGADELGRDSGGVDRGLVARVRRTTARLGTAVV